MYGVNIGYLSVDYAEAGKSDLQVFRELGRQLVACSICQFCYSGTSSKLFDLSQNCVLESTELVLPIPNISWNSRTRIAE